MKKWIRFIVPLLLALFGALPAFAEESEKAIGIISAMDNEIDLLLQNAEIDHVDHTGERDYYVGTLCGKDVVIVRAGIGKVRAAAGAATLLNLYDVSDVIFTGIAGGTGDGTKVLDVVVAVNLVQHDYGAVTKEGFTWSERSGGDDGYFTCDEGLVKLAHGAAEEVVGEGHVFEGTIATGDQFIASESYVETLQENFHALACEMEGAAVASVCTQYGVPFVVVRTMSDKADGNAYETYKKMADIAADNSCRIIMNMLEKYDSMKVEEEYTLQQMVILSRHNIRSPLTGAGSVISEITPYAWFSWTSNPGELSLRGALLETTMGQYFRLYLEKEGLFPENYIPKDGAVRFYANSLQRTQATARYFSAGLLPVAVVPVECHEEYGELDDTFIPLVRYLNEEYEQTLYEEISRAGGGEGLSGFREGLDEAMRLIMDVTDMNESEAYQSGDYGDFLEDDTVLTYEEGKEPSLSGALKTACSLADALVLQYYEEPDDLKAAFGHKLTEEEWKTIGSVLSAYLKILFGNPSLSVGQANPILKEVYAELNAQDRQFSFLCGHDSTITSFLTALGVEAYTLPGAIEPTTPIGVKVVFERWVNQKGESFFKVNLVYQNVDQLRSAEGLTLDNPPETVPISFTGVQTNEQGMIAEEDLMDLFESKIDAFEEIKEAYRAYDQAA